MPTAFATMACRGAGNQEGIAAARCAFGWSMRQQAMHGAAARAIRLPRCVARDRGVAVASIRAWAGLSLTTSTDHIVRTPPAHSTKRSAALHPWTMHLVPTSPYRRFGCFDPPASVFFQWRRRPFAIYMKRGDVRAGSCVTRLSSKWSALLPARRIQPRSRLNQEAIAVYCILDPCRRTATTGPGCAGLRIAILRFDRGC